MWNNKCKNIDLYIKVCYNKDKKLLIFKKDKTKEIETC